MRKQTILILLILTNIWNNIHSYNLKQIADKEYMTNSSITSLCQDDYGMLWHMRWHECLQRSKDRRV